MPFSIQLSISLVLATSIPGDMVRATVTFTKFGSTILRISYPPLFFFFFFLLSHCDFNMANTVHDFRADAMVSTLIGFADCHKQDNCALLSYFADDLKRIALETLSQSGLRQECEMLALARQCHHQALTHGGLLHCDRFFNRVRQGTFRQSPIKQKQKEESRWKLTTIFSP